MLLSNVCHIKLNSSHSWQYCTLYASDLTQSIVRFLFIVLSNTMWKQSLFLITSTCDKPTPQHQQNVAHNHRSETVMLSCGIPVFLVNHFDHNYIYSIVVYRYRLYLKLSLYAIGKLIFSSHWSCYMFADGVRKITLIKDNQH